MSYIKHNFYKNLNFNDLAKELGMSNSSFYKHFKSVVGLSPLQYQKSVRLFEAKSMLKVKEHSVSNIALAVGYESVNYFIREYKKQFNITPKQDSMYSY